MKGLNSLLIFLKGMAMGAADVVPGVSGGTIAFISGIYDPLLRSINAINLSLFKTLKAEGIKGAWKSINGPFLLLLFAGIATSVVSLAKLLSTLLETQPIMLWSFFFGLILASIVLVWKPIEHSNKWSTALLSGVGFVSALSISLFNPLPEASSLIYLFFSGALAICAMILPGISGSFILVLLGSYPTVLNAVHERNLSVLLVVGAGAVFGLLSFSKLLKWIFEHFKNATLTVLVGFIAGSLPKIWPWKVETELGLNLYLPNFKTPDDQLLTGLMFMSLGLILVLFLEFIGKTTKNKRV